MNRKTRSFLSSLGIAIGIFSIFSLLSLGRGMVRGVERTLDEFGADKIIIVPSGLFGEEDIKFLEKQQGVLEVFPMKVTEAVVGGKRIYIYGINMERAKKFFEGTGYNIREGREFRREKEAVVGGKIPEILDVEVGEKIEIGGKKFRIVGVLETMGSNLDDFAIMIPKDSFDEIFGIPGYKIILVKVSGDPDEISKKISDRLERERGGKDFEVLTQESILKRVKEVLSIVSSFFLVTASVSLIVGGIGIMNSIYTSVHERIRIIGLLRSVGATKGQIVGIFLLEAVVISLIGCAMGIFFGNIFVIVSESYIKKFFFKMYEAYIGLDLYLISVLISLVTGCVSGFFPALSASKIEPAEALRYE